MGTTIGALTIMFVMASGFDFSSDIATAEKYLPMMGHATVMAVNPDGSVSYAQGDNAIFGDGKDLAGDRLYGGGAAAFVCIGMGDAVTPTPGTQTLTSALTDTIATADGDGPSNNVPGVDGAANAGNFVDIIAVFPGIGAGDGTTSITEVALSNGGCTGGQATGAAFDDGMMSHITLANAVDVVEGTVVTVTYTMETG